MSRPLDRRTVDQWVVQHLPAALRVAKRFTNDADAAEEVVQEALCRVLKRWRSYRSEAAFSTWMMQIVVNVARERHREQQRQPREPGEFSAESIEAKSAEPAEAGSAEELRQQIRATIDALPERQREVALLKFGENLEASEIAAVLQVSEANVHTCVHLARKRIAQVVGVDYSERK